MQVQDEIPRYLKMAAVMADAGEIRTLVEYIWKGESLQELNEDPMHKVLAWMFVGG